MLPEINDLCIVVWAVDGRWHWFFGYVKDQDDGYHLVHHLERENDRNNYRRKYPVADDVYKVKTDQIVSVKVLRDLNVTRNACHMRFWVKNVADIIKKFHSFLEGQ